MNTSVALNQFNLFIAYHISNMNDYMWLFTSRGFTHDEAYNYWYIDLESMMDHKFKLMCV